MATLEDHEETNEALIKLAWEFPILTDFMKHNHVFFKHDHRLGEFILSLRISPHAWAPVRWQLEKEALRILPEVFKSFSQSSQCQRRVEMIYDDKSARSLEWQLDALKRNILKDIPMLHAKGIGIAFN